MSAINAVAAPQHTIWRRKSNAKPQGVLETLPTDIRDGDNTLMKNFTFTHSSGERVQLLLANGGTS